MDKAHRSIDKDGDGKITFDEVTLAEKVGLRSRSSLRKAHTIEQAGQCGCQACSVQ